MIFKDYYKILGLDSNRISMSDIKIAYKEQAKKYHPDLNGGNKKFEEIFLLFQLSVSIRSISMSFAHNQSPQNQHLHKKH